ncbi:MAG: hypothetical protein KDA24_22650 [Deltaproteobacteria bacterium]|nr:hypothetical protein [Deltaproteobacteria bacterium]
MRDLFDITEPCGASWEAMTDCGDGSRHCAGCDEPVYDIASLAPREAARVASDQSNCLRVTRTADDRVLTKGRLAILAASLVLSPAVAAAGPRAPLENHRPTEKQLERGRADAAKNVVVIEGELVLNPHAKTGVISPDGVRVSLGLRRGNVTLGRRGN